MLVNERRRIIRRSFSIVLMTFGLLLGSIAPVAVLAEQPPGDGGPTRARLIELAAQYPGIEFNDDYTGPLPATLVEAHRQLAALATVRDSIETMPTSILTVEPAPWSASSTSVGWSSCDAYLSTAAIFRVYDIFRVRHRVTTTRRGASPNRIISISDHSTAPIVGDLRMDGITVQATYSELSRWTVGPEIDIVTPHGVPHAFWSLFSRYDVHFDAGPFIHSVNGVTRGCVIE